MNGLISQTMSSTPAVESSSLHQTKSEYADSHYFGAFPTSDFEIGIVYVIMNTVGHMKLFSNFQMLPFN